MRSAPTTLADYRSSTLTLIGALVHLINSAGFVRSAHSRVTPQLLSTCCAAEAAADFAQLIGGLGKRRPLAGAYASGRGLDARQ
jgi:hypothetical protein